MRICVISDTHGDTGYMKILQKKIQTSVDMLIHLGDDATDSAFFARPGLEVIAVPGAYEQAYFDKAQERRKIQEIGGVRFLLTHTPEKHKSDIFNEPGPRELAEKVDIVLYGHTHIPNIQAFGSVVWINPGHMKSDDKRGFSASYCIIAIDPLAPGATMVVVQLRDLLADTVFEEKKIEIVR